MKPMWSQGGRDEKDSREVTSGGKHTENISEGVSLYISSSYFFAWGLASSCQ